MKVEESLNVTFDESPPPIKLSPLVEDDIGEEEAIERKVKVDHNVDNKSIEVDEILGVGFGLAYHQSTPLTAMLGHVIFGNVRQHEFVYTVPHRLSTLKSFSAMKCFSRGVLARSYFVKEEGWELALYGIIMDTSRFEAITKWPRDLTTVSDGEKFFWGVLAITVVLLRVSPISFTSYQLMRKGSVCFLIYSDASKERFRVVFDAIGKVMPTIQDKLKPYEIKEAQWDDGEYGLLCSMSKRNFARKAYDGKLIVIHLPYSSRFNQDVIDLKTSNFGGTGYEERLGLRLYPSLDLSAGRKFEHQRASGLLQRRWHDSLLWKWDEISMDFVTGLPTTQKRHDAIWVFVDRLIHVCSFLTTYSKRTTGIMIRKFKFIFGKGSYRLAWGYRLKFSSNISHPSTDGQSERTIQTLEDMLRACALEWTGSWDEYLCLILGVGFGLAYHQSTPLTAMLGHVIFGNVRQHEFVYTVPHRLSTLKSFSAMKCFSRGVLARSYFVKEEGWELALYGIIMDTSRFEAITKWPRDLTTVSDGEKFFWGVLAITVVLLRVSPISFTSYQLMRKGSVCFLIYSDASKERFRVVFDAIGKVMPTIQDKLKPYEIKEAQWDDGEYGLLCSMSKRNFARKAYDGKLIVIHLPYSSRFNQDVIDLKTSNFGGTGYEERLGLRLYPSLDLSAGRKFEHQRASGLLQRRWHDSLLWKWDEISMDFVTGLPTTQKRHDAIWVFVDRLIHVCSFLTTYSKRTTGIMIRKFKFIFGKGSYRLAWGYRLKFSSNISHPSTDGQSERTIQTLEDMLRACALEWTGSWDEYLCLVSLPTIIVGMLAQGTLLELLYG
ncbi:retrotransposable element Tf2 [Tanacetum coccineum]|uniref:Retrotransposable element Tf2 n=1 Tax=Tanacetum coccineum TaxID=301880 RepID=A0ABQ4YY27_9ASTR